MQMKIYIAGTGATIAKTGIAILTGASLYFRYTSNSEPFKILKIFDTPDYSGNSGTQIVGFIETGWFNVDFSKKQISDVNNFVGKMAYLDVSGTVIIKGRVKISFSVVDDDFNIIPLIAKNGVPTSGALNFIFKSVNTHGKIKDITNGCWDYM